MKQNEQTEARVRDTENTQSSRGQRGQGRRAIDEGDPQYQVLLKMMKHRMKCTEWGKATEKGVSLDRDEDSWCYGDHFEMYRNIETLCWVPGTDIVQQVNYN